MTIFTKKYADGSQKAKVRKYHKERAKLGFGPSSTTKHAMPQPSEHALMRKDKVFGPTKGTKARAKYDTRLKKEAKTARFREQYPGVFPKKIEWELRREAFKAAREERKNALQTGRPTSD